VGEREREREIGQDRDGEVSGDLRGPDVQQHRHHAMPRSHRVSTNLDEEAPRTAFAALKIGPFILQRR
jgi:hypothetical protein